jgi:hypothetical protein
MAISLEAETCSPRLLVVIQQLELLAQRQRLVDPRRPHVRLA